MGVWSPSVSTSALAVGLIGATQLDYIVLAAIYLIIVAFTCCDVQRFRTMNTVFGDNKITEKNIGVNLRHQWLQIQSEKK